MAPIEKTLPAMQETQVQSLGREDPLQEEMAMHSRILFFFLSFIYFFKFYFIFKLYNIVLVLPNIEMNPPQVYSCSPS